VNKLTAILLVLIAVLQYRLWFGDGSVRELHQLGERIEELKQEGAKRRERNIAFEAEVMDLKEGTDAIEERARHDLGMIKEGEVFIQVIDHHHPEVRRQSSPPPAATETQLGENGKHRRRLHWEQQSQEARMTPTVDPGGETHPAGR
jgi:cell division protein FtsB